jgi:hypothetical protein
MLEGRPRKGDDKRAGAIARRVGTVNRFAFLGVIVAAVFAFN